MKLLRVDPLEEAQRKLLACALALGPRVERVPLAEAHGRLLAQDLLAGEDVPHFRRSTVDGYALRAKDTAAAGESLPVLLTLNPPVEMGRAAQGEVKPGHCAYVPTGGMVPNGADGVAMVEYSELLGSDRIAISSPVAPGENLVQRGEDAIRGDRVIARGSQIRAQEIGILAALGIAEVTVCGPLSLALLSTGDELVATSQHPGPGQVRDINTYTLAALAQRSGYDLCEAQVVKDDPAALSSAVGHAMSLCDVVVVSGGSSQGEKDVTRQVLDGLARPGVFTHGLAVKPGKPTIIAYDESSRTLLLGLPGHPVAAMIVFEQLLGWLYRQLTGAAKRRPIAAVAAVNIPASPGRHTYQPVRLARDTGGYTAMPVYGKSGLISTLTQAEGYIAIGRNQEGVRAGDLVDVHMF